MIDFRAEDLAGWAQRKLEEKINARQLGKAKVMDPMVVPSVDPLVTLGTFARMLRDHLAELALLADEVDGLLDDPPTESTINAVALSAKKLPPELLVGIQQFLHWKSRPELELIARALEAVDPPRVAAWLDLASMRA